MSDSNKTKEEILSDDEVHQRYHNSFIRFLEKFEDQLEIQNRMTGSRHGFVMLMIRDPSEGNVDIASSLTTESLIPILEFALESAKKEI